ncbi:MAG: hypothetical protein N4A45_07350 [Flavobacteriales bacterium]|jgi:hypothetical protein|nr:hypothetical protein [Flavobacteriales bacterium]
MRTLFFAGISIALSIFSSCRNEKKEFVELKPDLVEKNNLKQKSANFIVNEIDSLFENGILLKKSYPSMSTCGGGVTGYYYNNELKLIDSKYNAELGFSSKKVYWSGNKILKIKYRQYFAQWRKYDKKYPHEKFEFDPNKMTYSDTIYKITFGDKNVFQKIASNKIISTKTDPKMIEELTNCGKRMKAELETLNESR